MKKIGIYNPYLETKGGGEKVCLALASVLSQAPDSEVHLISHKVPDIKLLSAYFSVDLSKVKLHVISNETFGMKVIHRLPIPGGFKNLASDSRLSWKLKRSGYDVFVNNCYQSNLPGPSKQNIYMCMFPQLIRLKNHGRGPLYAVYFFMIHWLYRLLLHPTKHHAIDSYDLITANSRYTQGYIKEFWNRDSEVLTPICDDMFDASVKKERAILNVGRFFEQKDSHHKRQDFLIKTFAGMSDLHEQGWQLHIAGSVTEEVKSLKYLLELIKSSEGLPIFLHFNASFDELKRLYNQATIYWHATGYGSQADEYPERQEHFGISTVEAMSAHAIPVVIDSAGQKEIVNEADNGFLWQTQPELEAKSRAVVAMTAQQRTALSDSARTTSKKFNGEAFAKRVREIFGAYL